MSNSIKIPLAKPVTVGTGEKAVAIDEITLREPVAREMELSAHADTNVGALITLIGLVSGLDRKIVEKFSRGDLQAAENTLDSLSGPGDVDVDPGAEEFTLTLTVPVSTGSGEGAIAVTELDLRPPVAGELEKAARRPTSVGALIMIISLVSKQPLQTIAKLSRTDLRAAEKALDSFTEGGQATPMDGDG